MYRIKVGDFKLGREEKRMIGEVLESGHLSEGAKVKEFEERWAKFIGTKYCVVVNSGSSALIAGLLALKQLFNIKEKAKVITSPLTFIATVNAVVAAGLEPVFADVDETTFVIKPDKVQKLIEEEKGVSVILPVHLIGYPADMGKINALAKENQLLVMEDAAQAHGTIHKNKKLGSLSSLGCFSFYIAHNVQAGEMGAVVTDDFNIYKMIKKIKAQGRLCSCPICAREKGKCPYKSSLKADEDFDPRFYHDIFGFNFKVMEFQAALGLAQLKKVENVLLRRRYNVRYLNEGLRPYREVLRLPQYSDDVSYLSYPIVIKKPDIISRKILTYSLEQSGIETRPIFNCIPTQQPAYAHLKKKYEGLLPNAEYIGSHGFYIGCHQYLTKRDLDRIIGTFKKVLK